MCKKLLLIAVLVIPLMGGLAGYAESAPAQPINIGIVTSLTGFASSLAKDQVNAATLAVKEINGQGGLLGRQVVLLVRDDELKPDVAVRKFDELVKVDKIVAIFGGASSVASVAVSEKAMQYSIPLLGVAQIKTFQKPGRQTYQFGSTIVDAIAGLAGADYAVKNLGKRQYIVYSDYAFGTDELYAWEKGVKKYGGELIGKIPIPMGAQDYAPFLTKVLVAKPDVLVLAMGGADAINAIKQVHELGLKEKMKIFCEFSDAYTTERGVGPKAMEGVYVGTGFYWEIEKFHPTAKKFVAAYQADYGIKPGAMAYNVYAGVQGWAEAVRITKRLDGEIIKETFGSPTFGFDAGKGKVRWRLPDRSPIEEWYICRGRAAADVAAEPDRILDVIKVMGPSEEYLYSLEELGYK